jgi:beta-lactamase class D
MQGELRRVQQQEKYVKTNPKTCAEGSLLTFFVEYKALLAANVARLKLRQRTQVKKTSPMPPHNDWQGYIDPTDWQRLSALWEATPITYRMGAKHPALFSVHPEDATPFVPTRTTLREGPSPAERLG